MFQTGSSEAATTFQVLFGNTSLPSNPETADIYKVNEVNHYIFCLFAVEK